MQAVSSKERAPLASVEADNAIEFPVAKLEKVVEAAETFGKLKRYTRHLEGHLKVRLFRNVLWDGAFFPPAVAVASGPLWERRAGYRLELAYCDADGAEKAMKGLSAAMAAPGGVFEGLPHARVTWPRPPKGALRAPSYAKPFLADPELLVSFCAGGLLPFRRVGEGGREVEVLLGKEKTDSNDGVGGWKLNPLCGKREESVDVDAVDCAVREAEEEAAFVFGPQWRARMAGLLRGSRDSGGGGGGGRAGGCGEGDVGALAAGFAALALGGSESITALWLNKGAAAIFLVPLTALLEGTPIADGKALVDTHAKVRAGMSKEEALRSECSMVSLEWVPLVSKGPRWLELSHLAREVFPLALSVFKK